MIADSDIWEHQIVSWVPSSEVTDDEDVNCCDVVERVVLVDDALIAFSRKSVFVVFIVDKND